MKKRSRKRNVNLFDGVEHNLQQFETFAEDFAVSSYDLGFNTEEDEELDLSLFDLKGEDDNTDVRYMRPRPVRMPEDCVRYERAQQLAEDIHFTKGMRIDAFIGGTFIFGDFIEAFLRHHNCKAVRMTIATLSLSQENIDSLKGLMDHGFIEDLRIITSTYYYAHERGDLIPYIYETLDIDNRFQFAVADVHTKTCSFETLGGKKMVIHGSANLRSSGNIEQITIEEDARLYDFYEETYDKLFSVYSTINKPVRSRASWDEMEKRLKRTAEVEPQNE